MTSILLYHDVVSSDARDSSGFSGLLAARYKHSPEDFERHLVAIEQAGVEIGLVRRGSAPGAALTFDDGGASAMLIADLIERRGWRGHFFITTGRIGRPGFLGEDEIRELAGRGHDVGSHSHSHPDYMGRLSATEIQREWSESRDRLGEILGSAPATAALPGGYLSTAVVGGASRAGYEVLMTSEPIRRVRIVDGLMVLGRYALWSSTPAATAAAYACGSMPARTRLWMEWQLKGAAKRVSPSLYDSLRRVRAGSRPNRRSRPEA